MEQLLFHDASLDLPQKKLFKNFGLGNITIQEMAYSLKLTSNKRDPIFINGVFSATQPYFYDQDIPKK